MLRKMSFTHLQSHTKVKLERQAAVPGFPRSLPGRVDSAAVNVLTFRRAASGDEPLVLLLHRSDNLRNHASQLAFPGGKIDGTESPKEAALRELFEEVGIHEDDDEVVLLNRMSSYPTRASGHAVIPFVGYINRIDPVFKINEESQAILEVPLRVLADSTYYQTPTLFGYTGPAWDLSVPLQSPSLPLLWGLSARVLADLLTILDSTWLKGGSSDTKIKV